MKFLIQIPQLIFGGAEKVLVSFANDLVARGHEVEVLETYEKGLLKNQFDSRVTFYAICSEEYKAKYYASLADIKAERNPAKKLLGFGKQAFSKIVGYREYAEKLAAKHYAGRHFDAAINYLETDSPAFLLNSVKADKYLQWIHIDVSSTESRNDTDKNVAPYLDKLDSIICVSKYAAGQFAAAYPAAKDKTVCIYNFFDSEAIIRASEENLDTELCRTAVLSVGRMTEQKKYLRFLEVVKRLIDDGLNLHWYVLGTGIQLNDIESKIKALGLGENVHLLGLSDNPYKYMKSCDLFILPSGWEGFPTVTVEAKLCSCAVLATDVSGIREQLVHGKTGWIVDNNEDAIFEGMKTLLSNADLLHLLRNSNGIADIVDNDKKYQSFMELIEK